MTEEMKFVRAGQAFSLICSALDRRQWRYEKEEEKLVAYLGVNGEDIPIRLILFVDVPRQTFDLLSPLPFQFGEEKRMDGAVVINVANFGLSNGCFDYNLQDGSVTYRLTASFLESQVGEGLVDYMISCACALVDYYNDRFLAVEKGMLSVADFIEMEA